MARVEQNILISTEEAVLEILREMDSLAHHEERDRAAMRRAVSDYAAMQVMPLLDEMSVSELSRLKQNLHISLLQKSGYETVGSLLRSDARTLSEINGISRETGEFLIDASEQIRKDLAAASHFRLGAEPEQKEILKSIYVLIGHRQLAPSAIRIYDRYHDTLESLLEKVKPLHARGLAWFFTAPKKKREARLAFEELNHLLSAEPGRQVEQLKQKDDLLQSVSEEDLYAYYRANAAVFENILLEQDDRFVDYDVIEGGIPSEMAAEISRYELNRDLLKAQLRPYQEFGVKYILVQKNCLLGDEMGLGKTIEAIGAMAHLASQGEMHFMVVCPAGVRINWQREILKHSKLNPVLIHGADENALGEWIGFGGVAVTTYESIARFRLPEGFRMAMLTADEAQYVKNPKAQRTQNLRNLSMQSERTLYMSGTPLENRVDEMIELVRALSPTVADELEGRKYMAAAPMFRELLSPVYLRRKREDVLSELPDLNVTDEWCLIHPEELVQYRMSLSAGLFHHMRRVSWETDEIEKSAKGQRLYELLNTAAEEARRVLVFSWYLDTLHTIEKMFGQRCLGTISGALSPDQRQVLIDRFSGSEPGSVLLMQTMTGGTGLNIQAASMIIFAEPQIKPSLEQQALSRAYRMGQTRSVTVHRLLAVGTVDEAVCDLLEQKQALFDAFADESAVAEAEMSSREEREWIRSLIQKEKEKYLQSEETDHEGN